MKFDCLVSNKILFFGPDPFYVNQVLTLAPKLYWESQGVMMAAYAAVVNPNIVTNPINHILLFDYFFWQ
jgi:hypothetical protein